MKKILLKRLELSNFRGMSNVVLFNGGATTISGRNGIGKSTIAKAWCWLLTGYPSPIETKNFNLFDNRIELSPDTPKASVCATIEMDGYEYTIEKEAEAKFVRKRGSSEYEKAASDAYTIRIDGIETAAKDYEEWIEANVCPKDMLVYVLDGGFFTELLTEDKNKARRVLENVVGEIKDEDMRGDYSAIAEDMVRFTIEQIEERTKGELKPYKKRMEEIPAIIDDKNRMLAEFEAVDFDAIAKDIANTNEDIKDLDAAILGSGKEIEPIMGERNRILNLVNEKVVAMNDLKNTHLAKARSHTSGIEALIANAVRNNNDIDKRNAARKADYDAAVEQLTKREEYLKALEQTRDSLIKERDEIKERMFTADRCAYCGQELPDDKLAEAKAMFNAKKESEYKLCVARGKSNTECIKAVQYEIDGLRKTVAAGFEMESHEEVETLKEMLVEAQRAFIPFEVTDDYKRCADEIKTLEATLPEIPTNDTQALTDAKRVLMDSLETLNRRYGLKAKADELRASIQHLRDELRNVGIQVAALEGKIDKCREYKQEKADIVSFRVNEKLSECTIDMWNMQKDGTLAPDVVLRGKDGVKFHSLNFSNQIRSKVEMQRLFAEHYRVSLPVWIDEAACFDSSNKPEIETQSVFLYASDARYLTVE